MRKRVYIAGPISKGNVVTNVAAATEAARELMRRGFAPLCPQLSCFLHFGGETERSPSGGPWIYVAPEVAAGGFTHDEYLETDLPWVAQADAVLRLPGESVGADREVEMAESLGIPVVTSIDDLLTTCCDEVPDDKQHFDTGSVRDTREGKGRFDLLPAEAIRRLAVHFESGAKKYGDRNWEKGQPLQRYLDSALRHVFCHQAGRRDEDHLIAAAWNLLAYVETEHRVNEGKLPAALDDTPAVWVAQYEAKGDATSE